MLAPSEIGWYLVRTLPAKEPAAAHVLKQEGFHVYSPMRVVWRRIVRHHKPRLMEKRKFALFPSYVFVGFDDWTPDGEVLRSTPFVISLVTLDGINPARIRATVVEELRSRFGEQTTGPVFSRWIASNPFRVGDQVELIGEVHPMLRGIPFEIAELSGKTARLFSHLFTARVTAALDNLERRI